MTKSLGDGFNAIAKTLLYAGAILIGTTAISVGAADLLRRGQPAPEASAGTLDLSSWDFGASGTVSLGGEWLFAPDRFLGGDGFGPADGRVISRNVPDTRFSYPFDGRRSLRSIFGPYSGSGTYRLVVLLPPGARNLAIRYSTVWTAFELEANGAVAARVGVPDLDRSLARPGLGAAIARVDAGGGRLVLAVRVSNHEHRWGGIARPFVLGPESALIAQKRGDDARTFLIIGALLGVACNALFIFAFRWRERAYLYFAAFAALVSLRSLTAGDILLSAAFPGLGFDALVRIEYAAYYLILPVCALFFYRLFIEDLTRTELVLFIAPSIAFALLVPFAPILVLTWSLLPYILLATVQIAYGYVAACLRPAWRGRQGALIILVAGTILLAAALANIRYGVFVAREEGFLPLGVSAFVIVQALVLAKRLTLAYEEAETLSAELGATNYQLMEETRSLEEANAQIESALAEKERLLQEVHHRVKNSLQIVTSIVNLQAHRAQDPAVFAAYNSVRDRIRAIGMVHDRLFGLESEKRVDLGEYARDLAREFDQSYPNEGARIDLTSDPIDVPMDLCVELGLILTELVLNAYRHAVMPAGGGPIRIEFRRERDALVLSVSDEGPGFPEGFEPDAARTIGFRIVSSLARQRDGCVTVENRNGAVVRVRIPLAETVGP
jgi:two-component sensor histidine kinase